jgi:hypothetical protein
MSAVLTNANTTRPITACITDMVLANTGCLGYRLVVILDDCTLTRDQRDADRESVELKTGGPWDSGRAY